VSALVLKKSETNDDQQHEELNQLETLTINITITYRLKKNRSQNSKVFLIKLTIGTERFRYSFNQVSVFPAFSNLGGSNFLLVNLKLKSAQHQQS
jgi:hypothetical protein